MAVDVQDIVDVAARTVDAYREAELQILAIVAHHLEDGIDAPTWAQDRLNALVSLRRAAQAVMARLATGDPAILATVARAARNGRGGAILDLPGPLGDAARAAQREVPQVAAIDSIAAALIRDVGEKRRNVLRHVEDVYRQTITAAVARSVAGGITRREASQAAWQGFVDQGVTSFTDVRGRVWRLSTYVEMAVRTVTMRAAIQGQTDRLIELGQHLVIVSDELGECPRCRPWEGKVLRITPGPTGDVEVESAVADGMVTVHIAGTHAEAMLAGLNHPNCGHTIRAYLPGATRQPAGPTEDPDNADAKVRQRAIERQIRRHKEREVAGLTPEAKRAARIKVRQWQATMRQHLKDNPDLKRLPYREEIGGGNLPPGGKAPSPAGLLTGPSGGGGTSTEADDRAKKVATKPEDLTVAELRALAKQHGVFLPAVLDKPGIIAHLRSWEVGRAPILPGTAEARAAQKAAAAAKAQAITDDWKRWDVGRHVDIHQGKLPPLDPDNVLAAYGNRLTIEHRGDTAHKHLTELETIPLQAHRRLRNHFATRPDSGFYVGEAAVPDLDDLSHLRGVQPRGWKPGDTWDIVPGAYSPATLRCVLGGGAGTGHGSTSLALHEAGHALDHAIHNAAGGAHWLSVVRNVLAAASEPKVNPYYTPTGNPTGYLDEMWAEAFAAWVVFRGEADAARSVGLKVAGRATFAEADTVGRLLVDYFEHLDRQGWAP